MEQQVCGGCGKGPCADGKMHLRGEKWVCSMCRRGPVSRDDAKSTFPFETTHFNGEKVTVNSMRHLRKLESAHGVQSVAYNQNHSNFDRG